MINEIKKLCSDVDWLNNRVIDITHSNRQSAFYFFQYENDKYHFVNIIVGIIYNLLVIILYLIKLEDKMWKLFFFIKLYGFIENISNNKEIILIYLDSNPQLYLAYETKWELLYF